MSATPSTRSGFTSPLAPSAFLALFLRPRSYFANVSTLTKRPEAYLVAWVSGIAHAMGRIDSNLMKAELGRARSGWQSLGTWLTESWVNYWLIVLLVGAVSGTIFWYLGGWWYRKRLEWSGEANATPDRVRATYVYQDLVASCPVILVTLGQTLAYSSYGAAWQAGEYWSVITIIFVFWSCATSYQAASTYSVVPWKARMWFLILPIALYVIALGAVGAIYARLQ